MDRIGQTEREIMMLNFENIGGRVFAFASALAISAVFMATAIVPASPALIA